ncbi:MAG: bifunctional glutamate N-acetyltransferase/amino-acid acetyltransferase ArgJ [Hyphomicrobiales bacterium]|nr:bifunctional glutamate N-acetyltransferase/amino-acid acetyltransferase ArgJ [Hyphomicrobiales bacterium]OQW80629.1 MAG: bifunctional ornithine acetyltransferase/N-acetylglutamate synthase [Proteobacteria bacterium ST_bin15]
MAKPAPISPLAPKSFPRVPDIAGVRFATAEAGIRYHGRRDVFLALLDADTTVAGVFTRSRCPSAPVEWCRTVLQGGKARALVVNSGNANAFTGLKGREAVKLTADFAARDIGCTPDEIFLASTGVIGEPLSADKFGAVMKGLVTSAKPGDWIDAARAIMTTDTFPKLAWKRVMLDGKPVIIAGIAKGAGMIQPDMATMLSFVFTDAPIAADILQMILKPAADKTLNCVTVDSDTSTSDTLIAFATGKASAVAPITRMDRRAGQMRRALTAVLGELAQMIARDGEGARKFITVEVSGAKSARSAKHIARSIANSPLVKTAIAGEDANWGRVVMAVGKAGEPAERDRLSIRFGDIRVAHLGERDPAYDEAAISAYMKNDEIVISVDLGLGRGKAHMWTCDLTKDYVAINGDYRS